MWRDRNGICHAVTHTMSKVGVPSSVNLHTNRYGGHAFSTDPLCVSNWTYSKSSLFCDPYTYGPTVMFDDGEKVDCVRRERPHLVFNADGDAIALTTGCMLSDENDASRKE